jgi:eukaryotic-like serine/threonine-protein kinase
VQAAAADESSLIGTVLADKYRVVRQIGRGGMGIVFEAEHVELGKRVAIKLMLEKYAQDGEATARFHREARAASRIGNPHIIDVIDTGVTNGRPFVVMELLNGQSLSDVIQMSGSIAPWRAIPIMRQVLRAVGAAHAKGIIHRDLKPDNIFIVNDGMQQDFVKLLDFGISKVVDPDEQVAFTKLTTTGVVMGTPLYMAPEQAMGHPIERFADIYACGVMLYEMLAGRPPFEGQTYAVLVAKLLTQDPPLLSAVQPGLPGALVSAVHKALEKEPSDRFQTAEQFLLALPGEKTPSMIELAGTLDSSSGAVAISPPTMKRKGPVRTKWPLFVLLAAVVAGAAVVTVFVMKKPELTLPVAAKVATVTPAPEAGPTPKHAEKPAAPAVAVGGLQVKSIPSGAMVSIDGIDKGPTPIEITLSPGRYKVKVALEGFEAIESEEDVRAQERTSVVLPLAKLVVKKTSPYSKRGLVPEKSPTKGETEPAKPETKPETRPETRTETRTETKVDTRTEPKTDKSKSNCGAKPNPY